MPIGLETEEDLELVDALAAVVDPRRPDALDRLRQVLDGLGLLNAFNAELRLSGDLAEPLVCDCEVWL